MQGGISRPFTTEFFVKTTTLHSKQPIGHRGSAGGGILAYSDSKPYNAENVVATLEAEIKRKKVVVLGTGWAGYSFLKNLKNPSYDVHVISPRNYYQVSTLESLKSKDVSISYWEAECLGIDPINKKVNCRSTHDVALSDKAYFSVDYDYLVIAIGARSNTFNTPGVEENAHFLKEVEDAQKICQSIIDCFVKVALPTLSED
ncbi:hypothetical protein BVRB_7g167330 [Beta vulgaris subsp. vulgaris]|nr:hypothetical protein BVRB_7g167330 [Beta vulgaris subsp. vulgaris]